MDPMIGNLDGTYDMRPQEQADGLQMQDVDVAQLAHSHGQKVPLLTNCEVSSSASSSANAHAPDLTTPTSVNIPGFRQMEVVKVYRFTNSPQDQNAPPLNNFEVPSSAYTTTLRTPDVTIPNSVKTSGFRKPDLTLPRTHAEGLRNPDLSLPSIRASPRAPDLSMSSVRTSAMFTCQRRSPNFALPNKQATFSGPRFLAKAA